MKRIIVPCCLLVGLLLVGAGSAFAQGYNEDDYEHLFKCKLNKVQMMWWCSMDYAFQQLKDIEKPQKGDKDKRPLHKGTDHRLISKKACVQVAFRCKAHIDSASRKPGMCRQKGCKRKLEKELDIQEYFYLCLGCSARDPDKRKIKHYPSCPGKEIRESCAGAGMWPHNLKRNPGDE